MSDNKKPYEKMAEKILGHLYYNFVKLGWFNRDFQQLVYSSFQHELLNMRINGVKDDDFNMWYSETLFNAAKVSTKVLRNEDYEKNKRVYDTRYDFPCAFDDEKILVLAEKMIKSIIILLANNGKSEAETFYWLMNQSAVFPYFQSIHSEMTDIGGCISEDEWFKTLILTDEWWTNED